MMVWWPPVPKQESGTAYVCRGHRWECWVYEEEITPGCALPRVVGFYSTHRRAMHAARAFVGSFVPLPPTLVPQ